MSFTEMQKNILRNTTGLKKITPKELAKGIGSLPGPVARSARSLVEQDLLTMGETEGGEVYFKRTAEGGQVAKKL